MDKIIYNVLKTLENNNYEAFVVGGYVRDYLINKNKQTTDIDICTNATPKEMIEIFNNHSIKALDYGNIIFEINSFKFEITTYRKENKYKNNRKPEKIIYIDNLNDDLLRRDFTINTICMNKDNKVIDILNGKKDIKKKVIRSVGDPDVKMKEDALRILRAIRFSTILKFKLDNDLKKAIIANKNLLKELSYERKKDELTKIFASENKKIGVKLLKDLELLDVLELKDIDNVLLTKDLIAMWSTITDGSYPFTKNEKVLSNEINSILKEDINSSFIQYKYGLYPLMVACDFKKINKKKINNKYDKLPIKDRDEIKISSLEICQILDKEPGAFIKEIYDDLEYKILSNELKNDNKNINDYIIKKYMV